MENDIEPTTVTVMPDRLTEVQSLIKFQASQRSHPYRISSQRRSRRR